MASIMSDVHRMSRREFLAVTGMAGAGLLLGVTLPLDETFASPAGEPSAFAPDILLQVSPDGTATVWVTRSEMGQGVRTGMPMIVAEELELPWERVRVEQAPGANDGRYGPQLTGGSLSVRLMYDRLRHVGAVARDMLLGAAAAQWGVEPDRCSARDGAVHAGDGRSVGYGELVETAASLDVPDPTAVTLKSPQDFRLIGTRIPRTDLAGFVDGSARYGFDTRIEGMRYAAVLRCPVYGGTLRRLDDSAARRVPGVHEVFQTEGRGDDFYIAPGVAVVADNTHAALRGVRALDVAWDGGANAEVTTAELETRMRALAKRPGEVLRSDGDGAATLDAAASTVEARYEIPFLAHAPMEPMNCTIRVDDDACEIWTPSQNPQAVQRMVAEYLGLPEDRVSVHVTLLGGGFGRRLYADAELEAAMIARHVDGPVQVVWTRQDDIKHDRYRPASVHALRGALGDDGLPLAWHWRIVNSYTGRFDPNDFPALYVPNYHVEYTQAPFILPRGAWRATVNSYNPFVVQSFVDELAAAAGRDPLEFRLDILRRSTAAQSRYAGARMLRVLETAADKAGWGDTLPDGAGRGVAFHAGYGSFVAEVAEVEVVRGTPRVRRVVCVVDCGQVVNPDLVEAQCEGAITFALSAALKQKITVEDGRVVQTNFSDFPTLTMGETPVVETHIIDSHDDPGGMGEVPLPPAAAAVANAIFAATGRRIRRLPIAL